MFFIVCLSLKADYAVKISVVSRMIHMLSNVAGLGLQELETQLSSEQSIMIKHGILSAEHGFT